MQGPVLKKKQNPGRLNSSVKKIKVRKRRWPHLQVEQEARKQAWVLHSGAERCCGAGGTGLFSGEDARRMRPEQQMERRWESEEGQTEELPQSSGEPQTSASSLQIPIS